MKIELDPTRISWNALIDQKQELITTLVEARDTYPDRALRLEALLCLIEYVQDQAALVLGEDAVFSPVDTRPNHGERGGILR